MNYAKLNHITKLYFGYEEIAKTLGTKLKSARVEANRYVKQGLLVRIKRNLYILNNRWVTLEIEEKFLLANVVQVPSYISLMTALSFYEITSLIQQGFIESIAIKRTKRLEIKNTVLTYTKIQHALYADFIKNKVFFIATPEKAFLDALYLMSLNRYFFDISSIDFNKLNQTKLKFLLKNFPKKTQELFKNECSAKTRNI
ncbi:MAG: hypothetical protein ABIH09_01720 [Candidatus Omnitrophota bacterium]